MPTRNLFDVIVLGVGGMGSATVYELARRGQRVLGLEQFTIAHDRGSSHGQSRVIRKAYYEHPNYVPLLQRAYERWFDLERACGRRLFTVCGCLSLGEPRSTLIAGVLHSARLHQLPVEELTGQEVRRHWPGFVPRAGMVGVLEQDAGFLEVESCVAAHAQAARAAGAEIHEQEAVLSWKASSGAVEVTATGGVYRAAGLVITAGAWTTRVLSDLRLPLQVLRQPLLWYGTSQPDLYQLGRCPVYLADLGDRTFYGFPMLDALGVKAALHLLGRPVDDPAQLDRAVTESDETEVRGFLREFLPAVDGPLLHSAVCMYTCTPDLHFLLDRHPAHPQVVLAAGFSGHGFKFASVVGEIMADLATAGTTALPIEMFCFERLTKGGLTP